MIELSRVDSPIGPLVLAAGPRGLCALSLRGRMPDLPAPAREGKPRAEIAGALEAYFAGDLRAIDTLDVDPQGTAFQRRVWAALRTIAAGTTWSYAELARAVGQPTATRAVGAANGRNPIALVLPCHRVIASDGTLGGYGGGLDMKRWLLRHERSWPAQVNLAL
ncbi:MAG TPA: methylated-DNA--[protein]-cysteine S-methyltransferase [Myxococcales bacterium]|nr:methylated-DNA--[protein]-cysteine S-methyltransferase [Myxococcales bacterium]